MKLVVDEQTQQVTDLIVEKGFLLKKDRVLPVAAGPLYGLGVYAVNLAGLGPALDLTEGLWDENPDKVGRRLMMHALYGLVTAAVAEQVQP